MLVILALCLCILSTKVYLLCCLNRFININFFYPNFLLNGPQVKNIIYIRCEKTEKNIDRSHQFACTNSDNMINYKFSDKLQIN